MFNLSGKTALVTGASGGIGSAIATLLHAQGAHVVLHGTREEKLVALSKQLGTNNSIVTADLSDLDAVGNLVADASKASGASIDILVNNAAIRLRKPLSEISPKAFSEVVEANLTSIYTISRRFAARLEDQQTKGSLINITSIAGPRARPGDPAYTAAKGGLEALTRSLAVELAPKVRCNAIAPGYFATDANAAYLHNEEVKQFVEDRIPLKRWGQPDEIAGAAVFLASNASSYITGHTMVIDAGLTILF